MKQENLISHGGHSEIGGEAKTSEDMSTILRGNPKDR